MQIPRSRNSEHGDNFRTTKIFRLFEWKNRFKPVEPFSRSHHDMELWFWWNNRPKSRKERPGTTDHRICEHNTLCEAFFAISLPFPCKQRISWRNQTISILQPLGSAARNPQYVAWPLKWTTLRCDHCSYLVRSTRFAPAKVLLKQISFLASFCHCCQKMAVQRVC